MNRPIEWHPVLGDPNLYRAKVFGGWLIKHEEFTAPEHGPITDLAINGMHIPISHNMDNSIVQNLCFMPDPLHNWEDF